SYLFAFLAWLSIALGSMALWMLHNLTGGWWGLVIRRQLEAASRTIPLMLLLFLPLCLGLPENYPWARADDSRLAHYQAHYLNTPFFLVRAGIYFAVWLAVAFRLNRLSAEEDRTGDPALARRAQLFSGPGL